MLLARTWDMEISNIYTKLRYMSCPNYLHRIFSQSLQPFSLSSFSKTLISLKPSLSHSNKNPTAHPLYSLISSSGSPSFSSIPPSFSQSSQALHCYRCNSYHRSLFLNLALLRPQAQGLLRSFSVSSTSTPLGSVVSSDNHEWGDIGTDGFGLNASPKQVSEIIEVIKRGDSDLNFNLNAMTVSLSIGEITEIFRVLNCERVSAMPFFDWIREFRPNFCFSSDLCSLIIDNCGWLDDYETMLSLLKDFKLKRVCLTKKAFGFLPVFSSSKVSVMDRIRRLIEVLDKVGGSCRSTGIRALIEMFSSLGSFEMANFVMEITERKTSYYNILIREKCLKCDFKGAQDMLEEMRQLGCNPDAKTYNYLFSSLCKNDRSTETYNVLAEMQGKSCPPDAITFEIFIYYSIRLGKLDFAVEFFDQMVSRGIEPRLKTHAAFIEGYFHLGQYDEAYNYVVGSEVKYKCSSNMIYSHLVNLHQKKGNLVIAHNILIEMMDKGLRPHFRVYTRVLKRLHKSQRGHLARDLKSKFSTLRFQPTTETG